jgi:hypothetical protein
MNLDDFVLGVALGGCLALLLFHLPDLLRRPRRSHRYSPYYPPPELQQTRELRTDHPSRNQ